MFVDLTPNDAKWDKKFLTANYATSVTNEVLASTWKRLDVESGQTIINSYAKTNLVPLQPPIKGRIFRIFSRGIYANWERKEGK